MFTTAMLNALAEALPGWLGGLITAVIGFLGGVVGAVATPWARWGVEKRRQRQKRRRELIQAVREIVEKETQIDVPGLVNSATYSAIRPYMKRELTQRLESETLEVPLIAPTGRTLDYGSMVLDEMARLERKWKLN